jgi:hypothetical protein
LALAYDLLDIRYVSISDKYNQRQMPLYAGRESNRKATSTRLDHGLNIKDVSISAMGGAIEANEMKAAELLMGLNVPVDPRTILEAANKRKASMLRALMTHGSAGVFTVQPTLLSRIAIANGEKEVLPAFLEKAVVRDPSAVVRALEASLEASARHVIKAGFEVHGVYLPEKHTAKTGQWNEDSMLLSRCCLSIEWIST